MYYERGSLMLTLKANFEDNLDTYALLNCSLNPCFCEVSNIFEIKFSTLTPIISGVLNNWNEDNFKKIFERVHILTGGNLFLYNHGLITLSATEIANEYAIKELKIFGFEIGWCDIIYNFEYAPPNPNLWDIDPDDD